MVTGGIDLGREPLSCNVIRKESQRDKFFFHPMVKQSELKPVSYIALIQCLAMLCIEVTFPEGDLSTIYFKSFVCVTSVLWNIFQTTDFPPVLKKEPFPFDTLQGSSSFTLTEGSVDLIKGFTKASVIAFVLMSVSELDLETEWDQILPFTTFLDKAWLLPSHDSRYILRHQCFFAEHLNIFFIDI